MIYYVRFVSGFVKGTSVELTGGIDRDQPETD